MSQDHRRNKGKPQSFSASHPNVRNRRKRSTLSDGVRAHTVPSPRHDGQTSRYAQWRGSSMATAWMRPSLPACSSTQTLRAAHPSLSPVRSDMRHTQTRLLGSTSLRNQTPFREPKMPSRFSWASFFKPSTYDLGSVGRGHYPLSLWRATTPQPLTEIGRLAIAVIGAVAR